MQRMRLTSNVHVGLALGIATAGVILALSGCATTSMTSVSPDAASASSAIDAATLEQFSESERARILAVQGIVSDAAAEHELDPALINAVIWVESRFDPNAKSPAGARGLMQLMPATAAYLAKRMGEHNARAYDPEFNVRAGALYLAEMFERFGDEQHAVAAYHAGPGNVKKWIAAGQPFPDYSEAYVAKVMEARARFVGVEAHGRQSGARAPAIVATPKPEPSSATAVPAAKTEDEALIVPDVDTLPDAAEIHGIERVIREPAEPEPPPADEEFEPVFEVHPELDRNPDAPPPGWTTTPSEPAPKPAPRPKPKQQPPPPEEAGLGVLPDL